MYAGFWRRIAAAIIDLSFISFCCSVAWALLALGIGDPIRFSVPVPVGQVDDCSPWHDVTRTFEPDALEPTERLCTATVFGVWSSVWAEHQEAHRDDLTRNYADYAVYVWQADAFGNPAVVVSNWTVTCILAPAYFAWMLHRGGQTLGQRLLRVRVRLRTSLQIGAFRAAMRSIIKSSPLLAAAGANLAQPIGASISAKLDLIAVLLMAFFSLSMAGLHRRGAHDRATGTEVVRLDR